MSNLWWFESSWGDATCASCGVNIMSTGGDPDWGKCYNCFSQEIEESRGSSYPICDICGTFEAVITVKDKNVCSAECSHEAENGELK